MIEVRTTEVFDKWLESLKDRKAKARIQARIDRVEVGNFGDVSPVVVILLSGGDKSSQQADIAKAKEIAKQLEV